MSNLTQKKQNRSNKKKKKNGSKGKSLFYKLMNSVAYGEAMENMRSRIDVRFVSNKKDYLKWTS